MRKKIVAGNWKMNGLLNNGKELVSEIINMYSSEIQNEAELVIIPPYPIIYPIKQLVNKHPFMKIGAQNCHQENRGAFTGEVSCELLQSIGVDYVIVGHSERREYFSEDDELLAEKIEKVIQHNMKVIYCCGEKISAREEKIQEKVVGKQIKEALFGFSSEEIQRVVIAYEPVWAIGTGKNANGQQIQEMHKFIRSLLSERYSLEIANNITILYGGSVKPENAYETFQQVDVDGGLIGGASLKSRDFVNIIKAL